VPVTVVAALGEPYMPRTLKFIGERSNIHQHASKGLDVLGAHVKGDHFEAVDERFSGLGHELGYGATLDNRPAKIISIDADVQDSRVRFFTRELRSRRCKDDRSWLEAVGGVSGFR
jgi:hypothetical protein